MKRILLKNISIHGNTMEMIPHSLASLLEHHIGKTVRGHRADAERTGAIP